MKALNAGLLLAGTAVAGGMAYRLAEPPPISVSESRPQPAPLQRTPVEAAPVSLPAPQSRIAEPAITSAPPPVYMEPPAAALLSHSVHSAKPSPLPPRTVARVEQAPAFLPKSLPEPAPYQAPPAPDPVVIPEPKSDPARRVTLRSGDSLAVRLGEAISAEGMRAGEVFRGILAEPVIADGLVVGERGARVSGRVIAINRDALTLRLLNFQTADGQRVEISTEPVTLFSGNMLHFRIAAKIFITEHRF
jgi:hypothetical protein